MFVIEKNTKCFCNKTLCDKFLVYRKKEKTIDFFPSTDESTTAVLPLPEVAN